MYLPVSQLLLSAIGSVPVSAYRIWVEVDCLEPRIVRFSMLVLLALPYANRP
jgi:hypothetical protein